MSNKQSSIEWFAERIKSDKIFSFEKVLEQAKEIHKQEIMDAVNINIGYDDTPKLFPKRAEQYYNETFK